MHPTKAYSPSCLAALYPIKVSLFVPCVDTSLYRASACADRLATFRTWRLAERLSRLFYISCHIRYSPIGAASLNAEGDLGKINADGLRREGDSYVYGASDVTLSVDVQGIVGRINREIV